MSKLQKADGYIRRVGQKAVIPVTGKFVIPEIERQNQRLIKEKKSHLIEFEILTDAEIAKLDIEGNEQEVEQKKAGRPAKQ